MRHLNYVLHLYGDGQEKDSLIQFINQYHLQDIVELYPSTPKLDQKLAQSKITVVPSRNEGFGMVLLERWLKITLSLALLVILALILLLKMVKWLFSRT